MNCEICKDTGIDERDIDYNVACDCKQGRIAHDYHTGEAYALTDPTLGEWVEQLWEEK